MNTKIEELLKGIHTYLSSKLSDKQDTLIGEGEGQNIKSINGVSILGSGDIEIDAGIFDYVTSDRLTSTNIQWGNGNIVGGLSPIGAAFCDETSHNKIAFLNPNCINIEYSQDSGATWTIFDTDDESKTKLVSGPDAVAYPIGGITGVGLTNAQCATYRVRVTISASQGGVQHAYIAAQKLLINITTNGAAGCKINVETRTFGNSLNESGWTSVGTYNVSGWPGWNEIPFVCRFGSFNSISDSNIRDVRITLFAVGLASSAGRAEIRSIRLIGSEGYINPSHMASLGHLYTYDENQNMIIPNALLPERNVDQNLGSADNAWNTICAKTLHLAGDDSEHNTSFGGRIVFGDDIHSSGNPLVYIAENDDDTLTIHANNIVEVEAGNFNVYCDDEINLNSSETLTIQGDNGVQVNGESFTVNCDLLPGNDIEQNLGSADKAWNTICAKTLHLAGNDTNHNVTEGGMIVFGDRLHWDDVKLYTYIAENEDDTLTIQAPYTVKVTSQKFTVNCDSAISGKVTASSFYESSDIRQKNIHEEIDLNKAYELIDKCQTILYDLKDDEEHKQQIGVIAQEVEEFFPEIVTTDVNGFKSVDYTRLTVVILRVMKDLIERIKKLELK